MLSNRTRDAIEQKFKVNKVFHSGGQNIVDLSNPAEDMMVSVSMLRENQEKMNYNRKSGERYKHNADTIIINANPSLSGVTDVKVCLFAIVEGQAIPFMEFCLYRDDDGSLRFPTVPVGENTIEDGRSKLMNVYAEWDASIEYRGFVVWGDEKVLAYEWKGNTSDTLDTGTIESRWWRVLSTEIVNHRKMLSFPVRDDVCNFFLENSELLLLRDDDDVLYESPSVGYYGGYHKSVAVSSVLGIRREGPTSSLGPYYYFGSYERAMRDAILSPSRKPVEVDGELITVDNDGRYDRGGIVRFAILMGKTKVMMGRDTDVDDQSDVSQNLADDDLFVRETMKIRDVDAKWVNDFNSVRHGTYAIEEDGRETLVLQPQTVVKDYSQQVPLSYYYVGTDQEPGTAIIE